MKRTVTATRLHVMHYTLHLVSHTHWDREWYLPYQQFRLRLVRLVDKLLDTLDRDPNFRYFMLDGQTIILDDYLQVRPHRAGDLRRHIQAGRLLIGPWHVLSDEFLVGPESHVRNLLIGRRKARAFGEPMPVGYIPDLFGHIGQMPQILRGFGITRAVLRRGLGDEPVELWWEAPDGSRLFLIYQRDGYDNAARLPTHSPDALAATLRVIRDRLIPHVQTHHLLLMNGTDHHEPQPDLPAALHALGYRLDGDAIEHTTLPAYIDAVLAEQTDFPTVRGELRDPRCHHLLAGVLSTRPWIKQRNHHSETLLTRWAEPFSLWAEDLPPREPKVLYTGLQPLDRLEHPEQVVQTAWEILIQNHPHDSICGCSVDAVHREMATRFDQVDQIAGELMRQNLQAIADAVDTHTLGSPGRALVVFNPTPWPHTGWATFQAHLPGSLDPFVITDESGNTLPVQILHRQRQVFVEMDVPREQVAAITALAENGSVMGYGISEVHWRRNGSHLHVSVTLVPNEETAPTVLAETQSLLQTLASDTTVTDVHLVAHLGTEITARVLVTDVPGLGYRALRLRSAPAEKTLDGPLSSPVPPTIRNEHLTLTADPETGHLTLTDHRTGVTFRGLHRFVDTGDRGDTYTFDPPAQDEIVDTPMRPPQIDVEIAPGRQTLIIRQVLNVPASLTPDRDARSPVRVPLALTSQITLTAGIPRVDIETTVENRARDHRLRVLFPAPLVTDHACHDGHFEIVTRPVPYTDPTLDTHDWAEQPVNTVPQRDFTAITDGNIGLVLANRGLPEVEVIPGNGETTLALTLLRCVGWLSRSDLRSRRGGAGPELETPAAQNIGIWTVHYSLIPTDGNWRAGARLAWQFAAPMHAVVTGVHRGAWPLVHSMVTVSDPDVVISAVKRAEDGKGWVLRCYSVADTPRTVTVRPWRVFANAWHARLDEAPERLLPLSEEGSVTLTIRPAEIVTLRFED